jgi:acetyltransferase-like isoleucine patch superfamily enzyme
MYNTPVLFLIFNRLDTALKVFEQIRLTQPKQLFIAGDGGRNNDEHEICLEIRSAILTKIDWDCEVNTRFQDTNQGCGVHVSGAITWFFAHVEEGVILEDDCLPDKNFFDFCENNLKKYRNTEKIKSINGTCLIDDINSSETYYFSKYPLIWGWATWKRAWREYIFDWDNELAGNPIIFKRFSKEESNFWKSILHKICNKEIDTWDYQWLFSVWLNDGLTIQPCFNFISNIGFDENATHTKHDNLQIGNKKRFVKKIEIIHPTQIKPNNWFDRVFYNTFFNPSRTKIKKGRVNYISLLKHMLVKKLVRVLSNHFAPLEKIEFRKENNPHGIHFEDNSFIESFISIENGQGIHLGCNSSIGKLAWLAVITKYFNQEFTEGKILIGNNTRIGNYCCITAIKKVAIGEGVLISDHFYTSDHSHEHNPSNGSPVFQNLTAAHTVNIGNNCFIGMRVSILPGVNLGEHCVVGAHSVVTESFEPYTMLAGVPAKAIKRFNLNTKRWEKL